MNYRGVVIGCAFTVLSTLGARFLQKLYENPLMHELRQAATCRWTTIWRRRHVRLYRR